jgi:hypothetical protein
MQLVFLDFETYYDSDFTLRKITPVEYVLDPRFRVNGCAVKKGLTGDPYWIDGPDLPQFFASLDPNQTVLISHNALFDMCIVAWVYGFIPRMMTCTMSVARACRAHLLNGVSLAKVSEHLGLAAKGDAVNRARGMDLAAIKAVDGLYLEYVAYALRDVENCADIYKALVVSGEFPATELAVMDMVIRCAIQPQFLLDANLLAEHLADIKSKKEHLLAQAMLIGVDGKADLMSNEKFAEMLRMVGVDPPKKISPITGKESYALAKKDPEFLELLDHDEPAVQTLVAARLGHKSTLEEKRCERLLAIANLQWPTHLSNGCWMPMPLRFSGAHTHRLSGDWSLNVQNLPRKGRLRRALIAPPGFKVVVVDASQIEARLTAWLCRQQDLVDQFARGEDVYSNFASDVFSIPVNKKDNPNERFVGKTGILGLGFGVGWPKFQTTVKVDSKLQTGTEIFLPDEQAQSVVRTYRRKFANIPATWHELNTTGIHTLANGGRWEFGPVVFEKGKVTLPNGLCLFYHQLEQVNGEWVFTYGRERKKLYGGKLLENIVQALDRVHVFNASLQVQRRIAPYRMAQQAHDEIAYVVRDEHVDAVKAIVMEEMIRVPAWAAGLPLAAEAGVGQSYGDAK